MNGFVYDRKKAVQYAEKWWNSYNPAFPQFSVDCTNFISQCLHAGGAPMRGQHIRDKGWWCEPNDWSFSWSVAHSFYWYLKASTIGLTAVEINSAQELYVGDVICYDFEGDNTWNHTTIVVAKDADDNPLVNAHTDNSRHRYWTYTDSAAWTTQTKYAFFRIGK